MKTETYDYTLPTWAACPLTKGDNDNLTDEEIVKLKMFENELDTLVGDNNASSYTIDWDNGKGMGDNAKYFHWRNDIDNNLGGDVLDVQVVLFFSN